MSNTTQQIGSGKATPGPWKLTPYRKSFSIGISGETEPVVSIPGMSETCKANARLIAAAPALLEALRHAHNSLRTFRNVPKDEQEWTTIDDDTMTAIEQAIQKAEGQETPCDK